MTQSTSQSPDVPSVTAPEGKTSIDEKLRFGPLLLSYRSACEVADMIAGEVASMVANREVVIADTLALSDFANLQAALLTLEGVEQEYKNILRFVAAMSSAKKAMLGAEEDLAVVAGATAAFAGAASLVAPVGSILTAALGAVSLFREDVEYRGADTAIDRLAFTLQVAASLKAHKAAKVYVPATMVVPLAAPAAGSLRARLAAIEEHKAHAWSAAAPLVGDLAAAEAALDAAERNQDKKAIEELHADVARLRRELEPLTGPLARVDQRYVELQAQWSRIEQNQELSVLARMLRAEAIHAKAPAYLHCEVVASGGHHRVTRSLLRTIFSGDGLSFSGGAIVRWALLDTDGAVQAGGILRAQHSTLP